MKTLQTTQKRPYTSPFIEVLEADNDIKLLSESTTAARRDMEVWQEGDTDGWGSEVNDN